MNTHFVFPVVAALCSLAAADQGDGQGQVFSSPSSLSTFAAEFLKVAIDTDRENVVFSPWSIGLVLAALQQGASGETRSQLTRALGFSPIRSRIHFRTMLDHFQRAIPTAVVRWGNKIYVQKGFDVSEEFRDVAENYFNVSVEVVDFRNGATADSIEEWISDIVDHRVTKALDRGSLTEESNMLLVNAIRFSDAWASKFKTSDSDDGLFHLDESSHVVVPFMVQRNLLARVGVDETLGAKWIELPYAKRSTLSMVFVLPTRRFGLNDLIRGLDARAMRVIMSEGAANMSTVVLPRFNISANLDLRDYLREMGLVDMFTDRAELPKVTSTREPLRVSSAVHQCQIEVNEKGTMAAAVSTSNFQFLSGTLEFPGSFIFKADEPFMFNIYDRVRNNILFSGKIGAPHKN